MKLELELNALSDLDRSICSRIKSSFIGLNNGQDAFTLTLLVNSQKLVFVKQNVSEIEARFRELDENLVELRNENEMYWDSALESVAKLLQGELPDFGVYPQDYSSLEKQSDIDDRSYSSSYYDRFALDHGLMP